MSRKSGKDKPDPSSTAARSGRTREELERQRIEPRHPDDVESEPERPAKPGIKPDRQAKSGKGGK